MADIVTALALVQTAIAQCAADNVPTAKWEAVALDLGAPPAIAPLLRFPVKGAQWSRMIVCTGISDSNLEYERYSYAIIAGASTGSFAWRWKNMGAGGSWLLPLYPAYGAEVCRIDDYEKGNPTWVDVCPTHYLRTGKETSGSSAKTNVVFPDSLDDGDYFVRMVAYDANGVRIPGDPENALPMPFYLGRKLGPAGQTHCLFYNTTYDWVRGDPYFYVQRVPVQLLQPRLYPRKQRPFQNTSAALTTAQTYLHPVVPFRPDSINRPSITRSGYWVAASKQGYPFQELRRTYPQQATISGPRGHGTIGQITWLWHGHNRGKYALAGGGCSLVHVLNDDTIIVLAGFEDAVSPYWGDISPLQAGGKPVPFRRLVHDASAVPDTWKDSTGFTWVGRKGICRSWGAVPDKRTTKRGGPSNTIIDGQPVHDGDVVFYFTDSFGGGRLCELRFRGNDPNRGKIEAYPLVLPSGQTIVAYRGTADPPKMREILPPGSLNDPWGIAWRDSDNLLYICERGAHGIRRVKPPDNATELATIVDYFIQDITSAALGGFEDGPARVTKAQWDAPYYRRFLPSIGNHTNARAKTICGPESIDCIDDYITWAGYASMDIRRSNDGATVQKLVNAPAVNDTNAKVHYLMHSISDGSFGPRWSIAALNGDNAQYARPYLWKPVIDANGVITSWTGWSWNSFTYENTCGRGGVWDDIVYGIAVRIGQASVEGEGGGMLTYGDVADALAEITQVLPTDPAPIGTVLTAGMNEYNHSGLRMVFGPNGFSMINADVPNPSVNLTAWLKHNHELD